MKYKLIALDLDGTLNNDAKVITPKTRAALIAVQKQGVKVALVSGRQAPGLKREADALKWQGFEDKLSFVQSAPWFYESTVKGVSKSSSLGKACERLGITPSEVMAFGDAQNDISMLEFAGFGVAMGNACDELKALADEITLSNNDDGIAVSLAKHFSI